MAENANQYDIEVGDILEAKSDIYMLSEPLQEGVLLSFEDKDKYISVMCEQGDQFEVSANDGSVILLFPVGGDGNTLHITAEEIARMFIQSGETNSEEGSEESSEEEEE